MTQRISAVIAAVSASAVIFSAAAQANPPVGGTTTVNMPMPGPEPPAGRYQRPRATMTIQDGSREDDLDDVVSISGAGIDQDGTDGVINNTGTDGVIRPDGMSAQVKGPLMVVHPQFLAAPAPHKSRP